MIFIYASAHHFDLRLNNTADPPTVTAARAMEQEIIGNWIMDYQMKTGVHASLSVEAAVPEVADPAKAFLVQN